MGFCLFANAVIAIHDGRAVHGLGRFAGVNRDDHRGNETQAAFHDDPQTLTISRYGDTLLPANFGRLAERGTGAGTAAPCTSPCPPPAAATPLF